MLTGSHSLFLTHNLKKIGTIWKISRSYHDFLEISGNLRQLERNFVWPISSRHINLKFHGKINMNPWNKITKGTVSQLVFSLIPVFHIFRFGGNFQELPWIFGNFRESQAKNNFIRPILSRHWKLGISQSDNSLVT